MRVYLLVAFLSITNCFAKDFKESEAYAKQHRHETQTIFKDIPLTDVPGFETDNPKEASYRAEDLQELARKQIIKDPNIAEFIRNHETRPPHNLEAYAELLEVSDAIANNPQASGVACDKGECYTPEIIPNDDLHQAVSVLETLKSAGESYNDTLTIYGGEHRTCKLDNWGFADCCADKGWGVDIGLKKCSQEYKALGELKEAGRCHYVGKYDNKTWYGKKTTYKSYCCFSSKLSTLTHEGGRPQIYRDWGKAKHPDCDGISPEEFQQLDFSRINLTDYYEDIFPTLPDDKTVIEIPARYEQQQKGIASW